MNTEHAKHLLHVFATFGVGGPQVRTCHVLNHFGTKYIHTIIAMDGHYEAKSRLSQELSLQFVPLDFEKTRTFSNIALFRNTLKKLRPDVLITYNWGAIEWVIANYVRPVCPHIHLEEGFRPDEIHAQKKRRILLRRLFLARTFRLVVPSLTLQEIALRAWKLNPAKVEYIPNGIACDIFSHNETASPDAVEIIIGTVAGLRKVKNLPRLIRVFSRLPKDPACKLWIVGSGPERETLLNVIADLKLSERVQLFGHVDDPSDLLKHMDIFAISSDTEQMPTSVLEAMASELPIVGTDVGDIYQMVAPANRKFIVRKNDEDGFLACLQKLIHDPELRKSLGTGNRKKCLELYSHDVMFEHYGRLFESAFSSQDMVQSRNV